ncbi:MAG: hypothetical protein WC654_07345, partial [Patescibacteria group bacterium]
RPAAIFEKTIIKLNERLSAELTPQPQKAPQIKIWNALIAYLLLVWVKCKTTAGWGLLELTRLATPCSWNAWICGRYSAFAHQTTDNLCYSISVPDSSVLA